MKAGKPEQFLKSQFADTDPAFSPDGRWIAYVSEETGRREVFVRPFPMREQQVQISNGGADFPQWSPSKKELLFRGADNRIMVVDYTVNDNSFAPGKPKLWSDVQLFYPGSLNLDLAPDGKRFIVLNAQETGGDGRSAVHVTMLQNFLDELKRRIP